jgi:hypothetical protein
VEDVRLNQIMAAPQWMQLTRLLRQGHDLDIVSLLDAAARENFWSKLVAFLFDSNAAHMLGSDVFFKWLSRFPMLSDSVRQISAQPHTITTELEWGTFAKRRVDILVKVQGATGTPLLVIGIENKVWAGEGIEQLSHYQQALARAFPRSPTFLIFLSLDGRIGETLCVNSRCSCIPASYSTLADTFMELSHDALPSVAFLLKTLSNHLRTQMTAKLPFDKKVLDKVRAIYANPALRRQLDVINRCRAYLPSIKGSLEQAVKDQLNVFTPKLDDWDYHPKRAPLPQEFKLRVEALSPPKSSGFDIWYMLVSENQEPFFGDSYRVLAVALCETPKGKLRINEAFPSPLGMTTYKNWWKWHVLWVGDTYRLHDLATEDVHGLASLLANAANDSFHQIQKALGLCRLGKIKVRRNTR